MVALQLIVLTNSTIGAMILAATEAPGRWAAPHAASRSTTSTLPATLSVGPMPVTGAPIAPKYCTVSYPAKSWPPRHNPLIAAHQLTKADVPAGMTGYPPLYATNGPDLDQLAVGFPHSAIGGVDYASRPDPAGTFFVSEILRVAPSRAAAVAAYRFARDHIYGDCQRYYDDGPPPPVIQLAQSGPDLFAFKTLGGDSMESIASFTVIGLRGNFVFDMSVGDHTFYPSQQLAVLPTISQVTVAVTAVLSHLPK